MTPKTKILTILATMAGLGAGVFAYKAHAAGNEFGSGHAFFAETLATLGVTDAQKEHMRAIFRQHRPTAGPLIKQLVAERRQLRETIRADQIDEKVIRAQAAKVAGIEADLAIERAHVVHEIKPVLTSEQLAKLKDMQVDVDERIDGFLSRVAKRIAAD